MRAAVMRNGAMQGFRSAREMFNNAVTGEGRIGKMQGFRSRRFTVWRLAVGSTGRKAKETAGLPHVAGIFSWASARPSWLSGLADSALGRAQAVCQEGRKVTGRPAPQASPEVRGGKKPTTQARRGNPSGRPSQDSHSKASRLAVPASQGQCRFQHPHHLAHYRLSDGVTQL